ncbi:hypothetical protein CY35_14G054600 [Sphagnum magellanicum]|nr:hypothetical protein CY35_14G054600 [Sphagnum magellanicum]
MESSELSDCSIAYLAAGGRGGIQLRLSADMALFFFHGKRAGAVDLPICDCSPYWPLRSAAPTPCSHCFISRVACNNYQTRLPPIRFTRRTMPCLPRSVTDCLFSLWKTASNFRGGHACRTHLLFAWMPIVPA